MSERLTVHPEEEILPMRYDERAYFQQTTAWPLLSPFARAWELSDEEIGNLDTNGVAMVLLSRGHPNMLISNLEKFIGLNKEVAEALVNAGYRHYSMHDASFGEEALKYLRDLSGRQLVGRSALKGTKKTSLK